MTRDEGDATNEEEADADLEVLITLPKALILITLTNNLITCVSNHR